MPVFYATDRARLEGTALSYGTARNPGGSLFLGKFDVSIPRDHRQGHIERPHMWTFQKSEDVNRHMVIVSRKQQSDEDFWSDVRATVGRSAQKDAFVFIHGFNVSFEGAVLRTAQIAYDLGFDGAPMLYSWPSAESSTPIGYATDAASNDWTVPHLRWFLEDVTTRTAADRIHVIAHSMGNKALVNALNLMSREKPRFAQIVLTAPDIDADTFVQIADAVRGNAQMTTLYASAKDKALVASKTLQSYRRAGDTSSGAIVVQGIDTIDVSEVDTDLGFNHSYYGDNASVISDIFLILTQALPPPKRPRLRQTGSPPSQYWRFVP